MTTRLNKYLADAGIASRRKAEILIADGRVSVNGAVATTPALQIGTDDNVSVDGKTIHTHDTIKLWRYYKPAGLLCTHDDPQGRPTVFDTLPRSIGRVISVGRLDLDSEGLLLLTNNGELARTMEHPDAALERVYKVRLFGTPTKETLRSIESGVTIEGIEYRPANVTVQRSKGSNSWLTITLREGKNREIRRIFEHFGHPVSRLIRLSYGGFALDDMNEGAVLEVSQKRLRQENLL